MPIVTVQCITSKSDRYPNSKVQELADALGDLFQSEPGGTWVKFEYLDRSSYAENDIALDSGVHPTFVEILKRSLPDKSVLAEEASRISALTGQILSRPAESVHVIYLPEGSGRVAFGGNLVGN